MRVLITGGAGFIGSAMIRLLLDETEHVVLNFDKLTYAGSLDSLASVLAKPNYKFIQGDISNKALLCETFKNFQPTTVMNFAAESHVDRSIDAPAAFVQTNIVGTSVLLDVSLEYWRQLEENEKHHFRFHHVSTDEVYGSLEGAGLFSEESKYDPSSPYSATKASSDHLVRAWHRTYGLPTLITNCSNNYGPYQFPEKLIPLMILNGYEGKPMPVYGDGQNVRDWLYVEDHVRALYLVIINGVVGNTYNIGGSNEVTNVDVVKKLCQILDDRLPKKPKGVLSHSELIRFVQDRPGHDQRYAVDSNKIQQSLGWTPIESFESGLAKTVDWYLSNLSWCAKVQKETYRRQRLGAINPQQRLSNERYNSCRRQWHTVKSDYWWSFKTTPSNL